MESKKTMAKLIEIMLYDPYGTRDFFDSNYAKLEKDDLTVIIKELLYAMENDCEYDMGFVLEDAAIELGTTYRQNY